MTDSGDRGGIPFLSTQSRTKDSPDTSPVTQFFVVPDVDPPNNSTVSDDCALRLGRSRQSGRRRSFRGRSE
jgi:hypothetical protein